MPDCTFCQIIAKKLPTSVIYEDDAILAFMDNRPVRPGTCLIIPKQHIDHMIDVDDDTLSQMMLAAKRIGKKMMMAFKPLRVGMVVHGFGVAHAHLIVIPQHRSDDITSARFAVIEEGELAFSMKTIDVIDPIVLDLQAAQLRING
ncbi:MAG TPA: HIT family protein [Candidatus Kapabacteria bacterium]|nr:HIT family protein [Candidatus Kapabacteria bacterium]